MKKRKVKAVRFPVLFIVLAAIAIGCAAFILAHGSTYTAEMINIKNEYIEDKDISATSQDEDIIAVDKVYLNDKHLICVDVHSVSPGDTEVTVLLHTGEGTSADDYQPYTIPLHVNQIGTVLQTDNLNFDGYLMIQYAILAGVLLVLLVTGCTFIEGFFKARFSYSTVASAEVWRCFRCFLSSYPCTICSG